MNNNSISVVFADSSHAHYAQRICDLIYESALQRGTGIAKRSPEYIAAKMTGGKAVVALDGEKLIGFSYIECWGHGDFVATSGLIVDPEYRHMGLAEQIKRRTFELARRRFPYAKLFSITTSLPVMKLNSRMGYTPVTFSELTEDEAAFIREAVRALREAQEAPDAPEALEKLPQLSRADIGEAPAEAMWEVGECGPWRLIRHHLPCRGIAYAYRYFAMDGLAFDELPYATVLACVLGKLDTARHTAAELDTLVQAHLGNLGFAVEVHEDAEDRERIRPMFVMGSSALDEEVPWAARLAEEVLRETDFADTERIRDILGQRRIAMEQAFASAGHSAAMARVASYYLPAGVVREALSGVGFYRFLKELLAHFDERAGELTAKLADLAARLFTDGGCTLSFGGSEEALDAYREASAPFDGMAGAPVLTVPAPEDKHEAFVVASDVTYTACGWDRRLLGEPYGGTWLLASRILSYDFLWTEVRVKGGAYGAGFQTTRSGSSRFYSYRDPRIDETVERFRTAGDWLAGVFSPTESEMDGYVVSTVASLDAPAKARELLRRQDGLYFSGATLADRARVREEVRAARTEDVRALAPSVDAIAGAGCVCAFGNGEVIRASGEDFNVVDLLA